MKGINPSIDKTCCFTGPRVKNLPWKNEDELHIKPLMEKLEAEIIKAIDNGYRHFITGMANGVDTYCARIVLKLRKTMPDLGITLEAAIPHLTQDKGFTPAQKNEYSEILSKCYKSTIITQESSTQAYHIRNRYMVDNSSLVIAVSSDKPSGTMKMIEYAQKQGKRVVIIQP